MNKVMIGTPSYNGDIVAGISHAVIDAAKYGAVAHRHRAHSLLANCFNVLYCDALNARKSAGITHFCMLHADIVPQEGWLKIMLDEMKKYDAGILSAVVPIKNPKLGLTSTGIHRPDAQDDWKVQRLTMKEVFERPDTFTDPNIVINTGLMLVDIRKPWAASLKFEIRDKIVLMPDGNYMARVLPEDWNFSMQARKEGANIFATRRVKLSHVGRAEFSNDHVWGEATDPNWRTFDAAI